MKMMMHGLRGRAGLLGLTMVMSAGLVACDDGDAAVTPEAFELAGEWSSAFGSETITAARWTSYDSSGAKTFDQLVTSFDNAGNEAIVQNPPDAEFGPNTYGRIIWTEPTAAGFAYCTVAFGLATEAEAEAAPEQGIDRADTTGAGCGGFPWSVMAPKP